MGTKRRMRVRGRYRKPTYSAGLRLARIVAELPGRPLGWSLEGIADELGVHAKTAARYARALADLTDGEGLPLIVSEKKWEKTVLRFAARGSGRGDPTSSAIVSLHVAILLLRFVRGSSLHRPLEEALQKALDGLSPTERRALTSFETKIHYVSEGPKDYAPQAGLIDRILYAVVHQRKLALAYLSPFQPEGSWKAFYHPYTLMLYKRGLYLIGHSERHEQVRTLAVERIRDATVTEHVFDVPTGYSPGAHTEGCFGIVSGDAVEVVIRFKKWTKPLLIGRQWHPTQQFKTMAGGDIRLRMTVRGIQEVLPWVMGFGPAARVEKPDVLRRAVTRWAAEMCAQYRHGRWARAEGGFDG